MTPVPPRSRFVAVDAYRARREWQRYEGTGQRDLFRELRVRFLLRHRVDAPWVLDLGSGPGRFLPFLGGERSRRVALDLSREMLRGIPSPPREGAPSRPPPDRVEGDGAAPPFPEGRFGEVVLLGNVVGFAGPESDRILEAAESLVAPGGTLLVEIAPGPGERSRYLARLPAGSAARVLAAPPRLVVSRIVREGFDVEPDRHASVGFRRLTVDEIVQRWTGRGFEVQETVAVAPSLGPDASLVDRARTDPKAWERLLETEEQVGHQPDRWPRAAAVLLAACRTTSAVTVKTRPAPSVPTGHDAEATRRRVRREPRPRRDRRRGGRS